ncbi:VacJ family lipoprotein [Aquabacterium sp.]|jgi:phospholipid-binding lipoprotein MlaA|uniref:MlaA family lipoprotein n=1 Tax=Aquabacterium sp. TaxID=1872578 RepID=UPI002488C58C|nr:VacJ family lipoprotein [Aquabacterium sp.]MDI1349314.1 VacJ family lipoprotein [Aquabacterium sp.]
MMPVASTSRLRRVATLGAAVLLAATLQGCATRQHPDPIESWNRQVFAFNESLDANVLRPVATGYNEVTPEPVRNSLRNVFNNVRDVWSTVNLFLQGRFRDGTVSVMRVTINTTLGLGGLVDWATPMRLDRPNEDFGQTLGVWGVKPGAYIVWPVLGPSTLRDSVSIPGDLYFSASTFGDTDAATFGLAGLQLISVRAGLLDATGLLDDVALDKYAFTRDAYLQRRQNLIYEGNPPDEDEPLDDPSDDPEDVPPAAAAASVSAEATTSATTSGATSAATSSAASAPAPAPSTPASAPAKP